MPRSNSLNTAFGTDAGPRLAVGGAVSHLGGEQVKNLFYGRTLGRVVLLAVRSHTQVFNKLKARRHGFVTTDSSQFIVSVPPLFRSLTTSPVNCQNQSRLRPPVRVSTMVEVSVRTVRLLSLNVPLSPPPFLRLVMRLA